MNSTPITDKTIPAARVSWIIMEKYRLAFSRSPSPMVFATSALPPVPIIKPNPPRIIMNGITRLMAAKGTLPTKLDTNSPSTTPYIEVNTIITIGGRLNRHIFCT